MLIRSPQNSRVKNVVKLRQRRARDRQGKFIIEGFRPLTRAVDNNFQIDELFACPEFFLGDNNEALIERLAAAGASVFETDKTVFSKMAYRDRPEGLLATAPQFARTLAELAPAATGLYVIAEQIEKPGNLGTILRSADAAAVDAVIVCDRCTDIFNPNVVCASVGALFTVPVVETTSAEALAWVGACGVRLLAATPHADSLYTDLDLTGPLAIAVGAEQYGLTDQWMARADLAARIPMLGQADSLNVATATTLLLYEAVRQRAASA